MRLAIQNIENLEMMLNHFKSVNRIKNYMITLPLYMGLEVKILVEKEDYKLENDIFNSALIIYRELIDIEQIVESEYSQEYINLVFQPNDTKFSHRNFNIRRRFHDLIHLPNNKVQTPCPVVTFYSYKGGVGRTTLLTCYAQYLANKGKQVVIIDCDFEAPGFTNYFGFRFGDETQQKYGLIEYILDRQFLEPQGKEAIDDLISKIESLYSYKVGEEYTKGDIRVIKAGNYEANNIGNYLEGLARLDISNINFFEQFLADLKTAFALKTENSVILIDSRTGFNDTFATLYALSNSVVSLFGTNTQNKTGLYSFLDIFLQTEQPKEDKNILFVQSFSSQSKEKQPLYDTAKDYFEAHAERFIFDNAENPHKDRFFKFLKEDRLAEIGEISTSKEREIELYQEATFKKILASQDDLENLFEIILPPTKEEKKKEGELINNLTTNTGGIYGNQSHIFQNNPQEIVNRESILQKLRIPDIRAERIRQQQKKKDFFFRRGMSDIFNWDKFIISGSKGTGKTFIYEGMDIPIIQKELCYREDKNPEDYFFINILPVYDTPEAQQHFETKMFSEKDKEGINNFFERFWLIYVCNVIFSKESILNFINVSQFDLSWVFPIEKSADCANLFTSIIRDNNEFAKIERQLFSLNKQLSREGKRLIIFFDQLDHVVEPIKWGEGIAKLVNYWRANPFSHILPKIFLRSDLMRSYLTSVNSTELFRRSISIEWTREEQFAYFFGMQLNENPDLLSYFEKNNIDANILKRLKDWQERDYQIPSTKEVLEPLVNVFFGKSAHKTNTEDTISFGSSYEWFAKNLQDGNDELSLRPFIWLIKKAIEFAKEGKNNDKYVAILPAKYYAKFESLEYAGDKYYADLREEEGNKEVLDRFQQFLRSARNIKRIGNYQLAQFDELIGIFINSYKEIIPSDIKEEKKQIDYIKQFLIRNGIIREKRVQGGKFINYQVPYLYKYYLMFPNNTKS